MNIQNEQSFEQYILHSSDKLYNYASNMLFYHDITEDIVQDAYVRLWQYLQKEGYTELRNLDTFMFTVIRNLVIDYKRGQKNTNTVSGDALAGSWGAWDIIDESEDVESIVTRRETLSELISLVNTLPERLQIVMSLFLEGFSYQEIAEKLSLSPSSIGVFVRRGIKSLRNEFNHRKLGRLPKHEPFISQPEEVRVPTKKEFALAHLVSQQPEIYKKVLTLRHIQNLSYRATARALNKPLGTIKSQDHRGRKRLVTRSSNMNTACNDNMLNANISDHLTHIDKLPETKRQIVEMHYLQGLSYKEISRRINRSEGTVKTWIRRAIEHLQQYVEPQYGIVPSPKVFTKKHVELTEENYSYIARLPRQYRSVMEFYYTHSSTISTIAKELDMPESTVKTYIRRAKQYIEDRKDGWKPSVKLL